MPKIEKVYEDSNAEVNPHFNPFLQFNDKQANASVTKIQPTVAPAAEMKLPSMGQVQQVISKPQLTPTISPVKPIIQPTINIPPPAPGFSQVAP